LVVADLPLALVKHNVVFLVRHYASPKLGRFGAVMIDL
jgi:hypothetical protein